MVLTTKIFDLTIVILILLTKRIDNFTLCLYFGLKVFVSLLYKKDFFLFE